MQYMYKLKKSVTFNIICTGPTTVKLDVLVCLQHLFLEHLLFYSNNGSWSGTNCVTKLFIKVLFYHLLTKSRTFVACGVHEYVCT